MKDIIKKRTKSADITASYKLKVLEHIKNSLQFSNKTRLYTRFSWSCLSSELMKLLCSRGKNLTVSVTSCLAICEFSGYT